MCAGHIRVCDKYFSLRIIEDFLKIICQFMFIIYNGESPECDFHFPTNKESGWREGASPLFFPLVNHAHIALYTAGEGDGVFLSFGCLAGLY